MPNSDTDLLALARRAVSVLAEPPEVREEGGDIRIGDLRIHQYPSRPGLWYLEKHQDGVWIPTATIARRDPVQTIAAAVTELARRAALHAMEEK